MKRLTAILLTSVYLLASVGVSVNVHYCGGKIAHVKLFAEADCPCGEKMTEEIGCCHDEMYLFQLEDEQRVAAQNFDFQPVLSDAGLLRPEQSHDEIPVLKANINPGYLDLPPPPELPLRIQYCSLTYYG